MRSIFNFQLCILFLLALALRLLVWRWHQQYPLSGDEQEYFDQALALLRTHRYVELKLMRPPLYTGFLAACIYLFDSLVQRLRLVQAIISALTVVPIYLLTRQLFATWRSARKPIPLLAALLAALSYTLAANATELLTETLFVFGLTIFFWLILGTPRGRQRTTDHPEDHAPSRALAALAGLLLGALILLRSVALPLLPLAALWLLMHDLAARKGVAAAPKSKTEHLSWQHAAATPLHWWGATMAFALATTLLVAPWTARNYLAYGGLILVDTTGAENLWLDNNPAASTPADPLGREAAKRALYALGDDRVARQRLATEHGLAAITAYPGWFAQKAWGEATRFFALQYFDDMRERQAIWVLPLEVWLRLLLGDGMWLVLLLCGAAGLWLAPATDDRRLTTDDRRPTQGRSGQQQAVRGPWSVVADPRWLFVPWALYTLLTAVLFHVELRYRLPLYPVLLPYAAWINVHSILQIVSWGRRKYTIYNVQFRVVGAALTVALLIGMLLLHRPYVSEGWMLAQKHIRLWQADRALGRGDVAGAAAAANAALQIDGDSALARGALARVALARGDRAGALLALDSAISALKAHPYAHLLRGAILREQGDHTGAAAEFAYERSSQEDLQRWSWDAFASFASVPAALDVGADDLGFVQGFWLPEDGTRWTRAEAQALLSAPSATTARLEIRLNAGRPAGAPSPSVSILVNGQPIARLAPTNEWRDYNADIPAALIPPDRRLLVTIHSDTFRPRDYDRANPDNRDLGVLIRRVAVVSP